MKVFDLVCVEGHRFEGWFGSSDDFIDQSRAHAVQCPMCESHEVHREPSAPRLKRGGDAVEPIRIDPSASSGAPIGNPPVLEMMRRLLARTEDVGSRFAEEARRIHYDETPARPIRGTASERERQELRDEGIETVQLPIPRALTETLQ